MTEIGTVIDGKYEVLREIGRGGMSVVYLAMDTHLNKQWAIKEIRKKGSGKNGEIIVNSLLAEANLMKRLDHPTFPRIVDIIDNGTTIYVVEDYIEGESLDKILLEYGAQPEEKVINWAMQIADALAYLHSQKPPIIYRDMKPANVMLKPEGNVKIIDFGIAREYKEQNLADTTVLGTKGYAPPEQYSGQTDPRSDIFALGMTMHHLLTGVDPRNGEPYAPVRQWNPELSEGIEIIIDRCVQPASENRYQSCADLIYDLEHPELITKGFKRKQKQRLASFLVAAILSVVMLISGFACGFASTQVNNNTYESLISVMASTSLDQKISSYKQAIEIYPYDTQAYIKILEAYENEGQFDKAENNEFLALYNRYQEGFDKTTVEYAELNYKIGMMYFNYYTENGEVKFSTRVNKAYSFFAANYENQEISPDFAEKSLSDCYYQICTFYKRYILSSATVEEASRNDYEALFQTIEAALDDVEGAGAYDQLTLYNGTFMLLYDQRSQMVSVNVDEATVLDLLDTVYNSAKSLSVQKDQSKKLQQEIVDNYETYREAIERAYDAAERS